MEIFCTTRVGAPIVGRVHPLCQRRPIARGAGKRPCSRVLDVSRCLFDADRAAISRQRRQSCDDWLTISTIGAPPICQALSIVMNCQTDRVSREDPDENGVVSADDVSCCNRHDPRRGSDTCDVGVDMDRSLTAS